MIEAVKLHKVGRVRRKMANVDFQRNSRKYFVSSLFVNSVNFCCVCVLMVEVGSRLRCCKFRCRWQLTPIDIYQRGGQSWQSNFFVLLHFVFERKKMDLSIMLRKRRVCVGKYCRLENECFCRNKSVAVSFQLE